MNSSGGDPSDKREWRRRIRAARRARTAEPGHATRRVGLARRLTELVFAGPPGDQYGGLPAVVAAYQSLPTEPPTTVLLHELVRRRRAVLVPDMLPDRDLDWRALGADARPGPREGVDAIARAGLVIVPALAVDRFGSRLGQGGGSYDRALARIAPGTPIVALLYDDEALLESGDPTLPREPHDASVTAVVTPGRGWMPLDGVGVDRG